MRISALLVAILAVNLFAKGPISKPGNYPLNVSKYEFIDTTLNVIQFPSGSGEFEKLFNKMDDLVFENRGQIKVLHIGASHIQADLISGRIREHFVKEYPGSSAGRGFVFPYSVAKTNTPASYASSYKGIWESNMNIRKNAANSLQLGLLGIAISTTDPRAEFTLNLDKYNSEPIWKESRIRLFGYSENDDVRPVLRLKDGDIEGEYDANTRSYLFTPPQPINVINIAFRWDDADLQSSVAKMMADSLKKDSLSKDNASKNGQSLDDMYFGDCDVLDTACVANQERENALQQEMSKTRPRFTLTGILTENDAPGVTYTNVGINGARVPQYLEKVCPFLESELKIFKPDLVIFAIGVNDANVENLDENEFISNYGKLIKRVKAASPDAAFIFETNNDMDRKKGRSFVQHTTGESARRAFFELAKIHKAGIWDKFSIMGGLGSMSSWVKAGLAKGDHVHFNTTGYRLLGDMFYKAFIAAYQEHLADLPVLGATKEEKKDAPKQSAAETKPAAQAANKTSTESSSAAAQSSSSQQTLKALNNYVNGKSEASAAPETKKQETKPAEQKQPVEQKPQEYKQPEKKKSTDNSRKTEKQAQPAQPQAKQEKLAEQPLPTSLNDEQPAKQTAAEPKPAEKPKAEEKPVEKAAEKPVAEPKRETPVAEPKAPAEQPKPVEKPKVEEKPAAPVKKLSDDLPDF